MENEDIKNMDVSEYKPISPFQRFKDASSAILQQGQHDDEETNQLNKKENE